MKWIKHDTDANQDNKLQNVLLDYGLEGYGLYWYCLELIGSKVDKDNITFELEHDARVIARNTGCTPQKVEEMMRYFVSQRLFEQTDNVITCLAMAKRLDKSMTSSPQMRDLIGSMALNNTVKGGYVYFIENSDKEGNVIEIKVGRSANPHARFSEHKKKYEEFGFNLSLVQTIRSEDCVSLETEIHRKLKDFEVRKEWFHACDDVYEILRHDYGVITSCKNRIEENRIDNNITTPDGDIIPPPPKKPKATPIDYSAIKEIWNANMTKAAKVTAITDKRKRAIKKLFDVFQLDLDKFENYVKYVNANPKCQWMFEEQDRGNGQVWQKKGFDYITSEACFLRVKEEY